VPDRPRTGIGEVPRVDVVGQDRRVAGRDCRPADGRRGVLRLRRPEEGARAAGRRGDQVPAALDLDPDPVLVEGRQIGGRRASVRIAESNVVAFVEAGRAGAGAVARWPGGGPQGDQTKPRSHDQQWIEAETATRARSRGSCPTGPFAGVGVRPEALDAGARGSVWGMPVIGAKPSGGVPTLSMLGSMLSRFTPWWAGNWRRHVMTHTRWHATAPLPTPSALTACSDE
jgi:hypothetical protein